MIQFKKAPIVWVIQQLKKEDDFQNILTKQRIESGPKMKNQNQLNKINDSISIILTHVQQRQSVLKQEEIKDISDIFQEEREIEDIDVEFIAKFETDKESEEQQKEKVVISEEDKE
ncbi:hypothetical protein ABPG72_013363 [Tetrahymena utriculariae]